MFLFPLKKTLVGNVHMDGFFSLEEAVDLKGSALVGEMFLVGLSTTLFFDLQ